MIVGIVAAIVGAWYIGTRIGIPWDWDAEDVLVFVLFAIIAGVVAIVVERAAPKEE